MVIRDVVAVETRFQCSLAAEASLSFLERGRLDACRQIFGRRSGLHLSALSKLVCFDSTGLTQLHIFTIYK